MAIFKDKKTYFCNFPIFYSRLITDVNVKDNLHEPSPSRTHVDTHQQEDEEILITNHVADNPSRNHIPKSSQRKRPSQKAYRFNKMLSRDPRWVAHISAAKPRREAAPARLPIRKRISEQRQIFWPNGAITKPPRRRYSAKKKHIGQMSSLVYCSYPPNNAATDREKRIDIPETRSNTVVINGDILSTVFYRPSTSKEASKENRQSDPPPSKSSTNNQRNHVKRENKGITYHNNLQLKNKSTKAKNVPEVDNAYKTSKVTGIGTGSKSPNVSKRKVIAAAETTGDINLKRRNSSSELQISGMGFDRPSTSCLTNRCKASKGSYHCDIDAGSVTMCKASISSHGLPQNKVRCGTRNTKGSNAHRSPSNCDILAAMFYRPSQLSKQSNSKQLQSGSTKAKDTKILGRQSSCHNGDSQKKRSDDKTKGKYIKTRKSSSKQSISDTMFGRPSKKRDTKAILCGNNRTLSRAAFVEPSTSINSPLIQNRNKLDIKRKHSSKGKSVHQMEYGSDYFDRAHPKTFNNSNNDLKREHPGLLEKKNDFSEPAAKRAKVVKPIDRSETPSTSSAITSSAKRGQTKQRNVPDLFKCMRKGQNYIRSRKRVRRQRKIEKDLCRLAQVRNALNIQREEDSVCKDVEDNKGTVDDDKNNKGPYP